MEIAVDELVDLLKEGLTEEELAKMLPEENEGETNRGKEPKEADAYTQVLNYFTQRNTEALVKCTCSGLSSNQAYIGALV